MSIIDTVAHMARKYRQRHAAARTARMISDLPVDIRKDIGWPDSFTAEVGRPASRDWFGH